MSSTANRNPGIAFPMMTTPDVQTSKGEPSAIAFLMPSGIEIR